MTPGNKREGKQLPPPLLMITHGYLQRVFPCALPAAGGITCTWLSDACRLPGRLGHTSLGQVQLPLIVVAADVVGFIAVATLAGTVRTIRGTKDRSV